MKRSAAVMAALMIVLLGLSVFAQAPAKHAVTPEELVTMTRMQGAEISPDGSRILYVANRGKLGFVDYDDIMAGVDLLVKKGKADPQKLVIGGWSYGGCFTEFAITKTDRFKAAVVGAGVANYYSNYAQSDINHGAAGEWEFLGNPYDNPDNFARGSAVYHIRTVKTPVLILHGKEDSRVPYAQGLELFRALKTAGKEVEMVAYPGEEHGFRKPVHNIDRLKRWSAFYDKHLGIVRPKAEEAKIAER